VAVPVMLAVLIKEISDADNGGLDCTLTMVQRIFAKAEGGEIRAPVDEDKGGKTTFSYLFNEKVRVIKSVCGGYYLSVSSFPLLS
jgi:hypothetical protein